MSKNTKLIIIIISVITFLIGVALIIVSLLIVPKLQARPDVARCTKTIYDMKALSSALDLYKLKTHRYPTTQQGLEILLVSDGILKDLPNDGWQGKYQYASPANISITKYYDLYSFGKNGKDDLGQKDDIPATENFDCQQYLKHN